MFGRFWMPLVSQGHFTVYDERTISALRRWYSQTGPQRPHRRPCPACSSGRRPRRSIPSPSQLPGLLRVPLGMHPGRGQSIGPGRVWALSSPHSRCIRVHNYPPVQPDAKWGLRSAITRSRLARSQPEPAPVGSDAANNTGNARVFPLPSERRWWPWCVLPPPLKILCIAAAGAVAGSTAAGQPEVRRCESTTSYLKNSITLGSFFRRLGDFGGGVRSRCRLQAHWGCVEST